MLMGTPHPLRSLQISSVMGITWVLIFLASVTDYLVIWWLACIVNSFQGVYVLFSFGLNARVRALWKSLLHHRA